MDLSVVVPTPLVQKKPTHRRWSRSLVPGPGGRRQTREAPFRKATQGHPQQRHVFPRRANLRYAIRHRSCQLASEGPCEHSSSAAHLGPNQRQLPMASSIDISGLSGALAPKSCTTRLVSPSHVGRGSGRQVWACVACESATRAKKAIPPDRRLTPPPQYPNVRQLPRLSSRQKPTHDAQPLGAPETRATPKSHHHARPSTGNQCA